MQPTIPGRATTGWSRRESNRVLDASGGSRPGAVIPSRKPKNGRIDLQLIYQTDRPPTDLPHRSACNRPHTLYDRRKPKQTDRPPIDLPDSAGARAPAVAGVQPVPVAVLFPRPFVVLAPSLNPAQNARFKYCSLRNRGRGGGRGEGSARRGRGRGGEQVAVPEIPVVSTGEPVA